MELLVWDDVLFLLRGEDGRLSAQRVDVDGDEKKVALRPCSVSLDATLPTNARLVATKLVEDALLATHYPVVIFQAVAASETAGQSRKRRRSAETTESQTSQTDDSAAVASCARLFFCILSRADDKDELRVSLLNELSIPVGNESTKSTGDTNAVQVFLMDGPYVLLFDRSTQIATVLTLQQVKRGQIGRGFVVSCECLDIPENAKRDATATYEVLSCCYVSERHSTCAHLLIHFQCLDPSSVDKNKVNIWSALPVGGQRDRNTKAILKKCSYVPANSCREPPSMEQVTCCCLIAEAPEWNYFLPCSEAATLSSWALRASVQPDYLGLTASTLLVIGTSSNNLYVYTNGILLASFVTPAKPIDVLCLYEDNMEQSYTLGIHCADKDRSFLMVNFSSKTQLASMKLLVAFSHVGHALIGTFNRTPFATSTPSQVLLLNDVSGVVDTAEQPDITKQLVKRSVLISHKPDAKLSCHRLRLREEKKGKKRARGGSGVVSHEFLYIERTQKASSHARGLDDIDEGNKGLSASNAQLVKVADSLTHRLDSGLREVARLELIVKDKSVLLCELSRLIEQQKHRPGRNQSLTVARSTISGNNSMKTLVDLETIVAAPAMLLAAQNDVDDRNPERDITAHVTDTSPQSDVLKDLLVSLDTFRVTGYVPSSSLIRAEAVLRNHSGIVLRDCFVTLTTGDSGVNGWECSSSVVEVFDPCSDRAQTARFQLQLGYVPSCVFLRMQTPFEAALWLHYGSSRDDMGSFSQDRNPSTSAIAVASVKFNPADVLQVLNSSFSDHTMDRVQRNSVVEPGEQQLLVLSAGSCLRPWAQAQHYIDGCKRGFLRPMNVQTTFALLRQTVTEREMALYGLSQWVSSLPSDVYVMQNPFQVSYLNEVKSILRAMRSEIGHHQEHEATMASSSRANGERVTTDDKKKPVSNVARSAFRELQRDTDLRVLRLLHVLQKRMNFHTVWFGSNASNKDAAQ